MFSQTGALLNAKAREGLSLVLAVGSPMEATGQVGISWVQGPHLQSLASQASKIHTDFLGHSSTYFRSKP